MQISMNELQNFENIATLSVDIGKRRSVEISSFTLFWVTCKLYRIFIDDDLL